MDLRWRIDLLGGLRAQCSDRVLTRFRTEKTALLLAYLAYHRQHSHARDVLVELLWPDIDLNAARNSLRVALHSLRQQLALPDTPASTLLIADRLTVSLNPSAFTTDVAQLQGALKAAARLPSAPERAALLARVIDLYRGELLPGYSEAWVLTERLHMSEVYLGALHQQVIALEQAGDPEQALEYARRAVSADPLREEAHYDLMRLYAALGQPSATLRQYQELERVLREELGETPSAATRALADELRSNARTIVVAHVASPLGISPPNPLGGERDPDPSAHPSDGSLTATLRSHAVVELQPTTIAPGHPRADAAALPPQYTRLFGREEEMTRIAETVRHPETRLVTLTGPGGSGKTRLAIAVAARLVEAFDGAVWFVPLAELADARHIPDAVGDALGLLRSPDVAPLEQLLERLRRRPALLVLDNFEHLVEEGAPLMRSLLERAPRLTCLVTSRQRLNLAGEQEFALLPLPTPRRPDTPERLMEYPSVQLFVDRAQSVRPGFQLTETNARAVAALCDRLEGLPLALELAAARASVLTPQQMLEHWERRSEFLVSRQRDAPARHRTLRAAMDASYQLLAPERRRFFARLSVFRSGWTLAAAESICADGEDDPSVPIRRSDVLDHLAHLQECSLVVAEEVGHELRYRLLETLREYAADQVAPEERAELGRRHASYYLVLAEAARSRLAGGEQRHWRERLEWEHDNLRATLAWSLAEEAGVETGLRLAEVLGPFWLSHPTEAREWFAAALEKTRQAQAAWRAEVLSVAAKVAGILGDLAAARAWLEESLALRRALGDNAGVAGVLYDLGCHDLDRWECASAQSFLEECLALRRALADPPGTAWALEGLGSVAQREGDLGRARANFEESLAIGRQCGDKLVVTWALYGLGCVVVLQGDLGTARPLVEQSVALARELGPGAVVTASLPILQRALVPWDRIEDASAHFLLEQRLALNRALGHRWNIIHDLGALGHLARQRGEYDRSAALYRESLTLRRELGDRFAIAQGLEDFAGLAGRQAEYERAVRLLGAAGTMLQMLGRRLPVAVPTEYQRTVADARTALGEPAFTVAWAAGQQLTLDEAVAEAIGIVDPPHVAGPGM
jgi:predicted ATPase/DNA-binding SARP family transcriptional activator